MSSRYFLFFHYFQWNMFVLQHFRKVIVIFLTQIQRRRKREKKAERKYAEVISSPQTNYSAVENARFCNPEMENNFPPI